MKCGLISIFGMAAIAAASPLVLKRQSEELNNDDILRCDEGVDVQGGLIGQAFDNRMFRQTLSSMVANIMLLARDCKDHCLLTETADNGNLGGLCQGICIPSGPTARGSPIRACRP